MSSETYLETPGSGSVCSLLLDTLVPLCGKLSASKALQLCHRPLSLGEGSGFDLQCGVWLSKDRGFVDRQLPQSPTEVKEEGLPAGDGVGIH